MTTIDVANACASLRSEKPTARKEGLKALESCLSSDDVLALLDRNTALLRPGDKLDVLAGATWPGLCKVLLGCIEKEVEHALKRTSTNKEKRLDAVIPRLARKFFQCCEDQARHCYRAPLRRVVPRLFLSLLGILERVKPASDLGQELSAVLRSHLLPEREYCQEAGSSTFQGLVEVYMNRIEEQKKPVPEDKARPLAVLQLLLHNFPGEMAPAFQQDVLTFFQDLPGRVPAFRADKRAGALLLAALNSFLLRNGLDVFTRLPELHRALQRLVAGAWMAPQDARLHEAAVAYLRLQLALGGLGGSLDGVHEAAAKDLARLGAAWASQATAPSRLGLSRQHRGLLELAAAAAFTIGEQAGCGGTGDADSGPAAKRRKVEPAWEQLRDNACASPQWGVAASLLLLRHGHRIPLPVLQAWVAPLSTALTAEVAAEAARTAAVGSRRPTESLRVLGLVSALTALARALHSHSLLACAGRQQPPPGEARLQAELEQWRELAGKAMQWAMAEETPAVAQEEMLRLLCGIAELGLAGWMSQHPSFWGQLSRAPLGEASLQLVAVVFSSPQAGKHGEAVAQNGLPAHIMASESVGQHPRQAAAAVLALLTGAAPEAEQAASLHWWQAPGSDSELDTTLDTLVRGEEYVARQALSDAKNCAGEKPAATRKLASNAWQTAAGALQERLETAVGNDSTDLHTLAALSAAAAYLLRAGPHSRCLEALAAAVKRLSAELVRKGSGDDALLSHLRLLFICLRAPGLETALGRSQNLVRDVLHAMRREVSQQQSSNKSQGLDTDLDADFDDDFDTGFSAAASPAHDARRGSGRALASIQLAGVCGLGDPAAASTELMAVDARLAEDVKQPAPHELMCALLTAAGSLLAASPVAALEEMKTALDMMYSRFVVTYSQRGCLIMLQQLKLQAGALKRWLVADETDLEEAGEVVAGMYKLLASAAGMIADLDEQSKDGPKRSSAELRLQLALASAELLSIDLDVLEEAEIAALRRSLLDVQADPCYAARLGGVALCRALFTASPDVQATFRKLLHGDGDAGDQVERVETMLLALGECASSSPVVELEALTNIIGLAAAHPPARPLARGVLQSAGIRMGYSGLQPYVVFHLLSLLHAWLVSLQRDLADLLAVREVLGSPLSEAGFVEAHMGYVVPCVLLKAAHADVLKRRGGAKSGAGDQARKELAQVAAMLGLSAKEVVQRSFPQCLSLAFPLREASSAGKEVAHMLSSMITEEHLPGDESNSLLSATVVQAIGLMLQLAANGDAAAPPYYPASIVLRAIHTLPAQADDMRNQHVLQTQILNSDKYQQLLNSVHTAVAAAANAAHVMQRLGALAAVMQLAGDRVCEPAMLRYMLYILLGCLRFREAQPLVGEMLERLIDGVLTLGEASVLGPLLQPLLFRLTDCVEARLAADACVAADHPAVSLISKLTVQAPPELHPYLLQVEQLPDVEVLAAARSLLSQLRHSIGLEADLCSFAVRVRAMPEGLRTRSLQHLRQQLDKGELARATLTSEQRRKLGEAAWRLAGDGRELGDGRVMSLAGRLLAVLGPSPPEAVAFSHSAVGSDAAGGHGAALADGDAILLQALQLLAGLAVDEDPHVVAGAQSTLRQLLRIKPGKALLTSLDEPTRSYLEVFGHGAKLPTKEFSQELLQQEWSLENDMLWAGHVQGYQGWVCRLAYALAIRSKLPVLLVCSKMVRMQASLAELLLPELLLALAVQGSSDGSTIARQLAQHVFCPAAAGTPAVGIFLTALNRLRSHHLSTAAQHKRRGKQDDSQRSGEAAWSKVYWLELDYLEVAAAALGRAASMTALLYIEEWCKAKLGGLRLPSSVAKGEKEAARLLAEAYSQVQEVDSMAAAAGGASGWGLLPLLEREGAWSAVLQAHDLRLGPNAGQGAHAGVATALSRLGCPRTSAVFLAGLAASTPVQGAERSWLEEAQAEAAWQMGGWREMQAGQPPPPPACFNAAVCHCLQALAAGDADACKGLPQAVAGVLVQSLGVGGREAAASVNPVTVQLQVLEALVEAAQLRFSGVDVQQDLARLQEVWATREAAAGAGGRFELLAPLASAHKAALSAVGGDSWVPGLLLRTAAAARKAGSIPQAALALEELRVGQGDSWAGRVEQAKLLWAQHRQAAALDVAVQLLEGPPPREAMLAPRLKTLLGKWQAACRSESSAAVLCRMKEASAALGPEGASSEWQRAACRAAFRLAQYADKLQNGVRAQLASPEWETTRAVTAHKRSQVAILEARRDTCARQSAAVQEAAVLQRHIDQLQKIVQADEAEAARLLSNREAYLWTAVDAFVRCLECGDSYDMPASFRLVQLWLHLAQRPEMNQRMAAALASVPSHKFLSLLYQVAARMGDSAAGPLAASGFQTVLQDLMVRLGSDHPYHVLYQLLALKHGDRTKAGEASRGAAMHRTLQLDKIEAATAVIQRIAVTRREVVRQVSELVDGYIELAALPVGKDAKSMPMPGAWRRRHQKLDLVPVVSKELAVDRSCRYQGLPHVDVFGDTINFVGGINKPKLIVCTDSLGRQHRQLVKSGNDDLRQDAVMQQFFGLVNHLLAGSAATRTRQLAVRTYKVVPFSPVAGLLEWVEETVPVSEYLLGASRSGGAHARFRVRGDWDFYRCYEAMANATQEERLTAFQKVCRHFRPCLHYFFLEHFREPAEWFTRRLAYTRSTAASSMAGYLIGLGDRHSANLLIDRRTAQVVHIDLGVAFEQGRFLRTPELVPFRLTRDIVDGMGATGVEGVMRRCCEETLRVLRRHKEFLATIVEVLIHDPLYKWALTARAAEDRQNDELVSDEVGERDGSEAVVANADAERALMRIRQKLDGLEGGDGEARGVEGQVQQLLQTSQDPSLLCKMYIGWAAWV